MCLARRQGHRIVKVYSAGPESERASWRLHMTALIGAGGEQQANSLPAADAELPGNLCPKPTMNASAPWVPGSAPRFAGMQTMRRNGHELFADVTAAAGPYGWSHLASGIAGRLLPSSGHLH